VYFLLRVFYALGKAFLLLSVGKRSMSIFTVSHARNKVGMETNQVVKPGAEVIEARVLHEEQHRTGMKMRHAYAH
jgi:hypothetical protein